MSSFQSKKPTIGSGNFRQGPLDSRSGPLPWMAMPGPERLPAARTIGKPDEVCNVPDAMMQQADLRVSRVRFLGGPRRGVPVTSF